MYHLRLQHGGVGWAYWRRCMALQKYAPPDFQGDVGQWHPCTRIDPWPDDTTYDLVLQLVPDIHGLKQRLMQRGETAIVVAGLNVGWGHHSERLKMACDADHIVVNNRDLWERLGRRRPVQRSQGPPTISWISNGVDLDEFRVTRPIHQRTPRVLWTGCAYHCKPNGIKGYREVLFPLAIRLKAQGIPVSYRMTDAADPGEHLSTEQMVEWYNRGTIYVCASSSEGTPNPVLEAAACGCVVVSTRVGNMPELIQPYVNGELVDRAVDAIYDAILRCAKRYREMASAMQDTIRYWDWRLRAKQYYDLFRRLIDERMESRCPVVPGSS